MIRGSLNICDTSPPPHPAKSMATRLRIGSKVIFCKQFATLVFNTTQFFNIKNSKPHIKKFCSTQQQQRNVVAGTSLNRQLGNWRLGTYPVFFDGTGRQMATGRCLSLPCRSFEPELTSTFMFKFEAGKISESSAPLAVNFAVLCDSPPHTPTLGLVHAGAKPVKLRSS